MKKIILLFYFLLITANCFSQDGSRVTDHHLGYQLGYFYAKENTIDAGLNYYWSINPKFNVNGNYYYKTHTFGPFACADLNFVNHTAYVGQRFGFNYHYYSMVSFHISPAIEHYTQQDFRVGGDVGVSFFGLCFYYGYYVPVGNFILPGISYSRFGIRCVFNMAPVNTTPFED